MPVRFRRQLISIADSPLRRWSEEVLSLAQMVADNFDDEYMRNHYVSLVLQMVIEQPLKTPFVAAVVLVANAHKPEAMEIVLARLAKDLESAIAAGEWREVKLYLKFMACLQGSLEGDGVFPLLEELFSRAADLQTASSEDVSSLVESAHARICDMLTLYRQSEPNSSKSSSSRFRTPSWELLASSRKRPPSSWKRPTS